MDRHPQQIKRERQDIKRRARNIDSMSRLRTHIKNVLLTTTKADADKAYGKAVSIIDKAVNKNLIHNYCIRVPILFTLNKILIHTE